MLKMAQANDKQLVNGAWNMDPKMEAFFAGTFPRIASEGVRHLEGESEIWKIMIIRDEADFDDETEEQEAGEKEGEGEEEQEEGEKEGEGEEEQRRTMIIMDDDYDEIYPEENRVGYNKEKTVGYNEEKTVGYNEEKTVGYNKEKTVGYNEEKTVGYNKEKTVEYNKEKTVGCNKEEIVGYNKEKAVGYNKEKIVGYNKEKTVEYIKEKTVGYNKEKTVEYNKEETLGHNKEKTVGYNKEETLGHNKEKKTLMKYDDIEGGESKQCKTSFGSHRTAVASRSESLQKHGKSHKENSRSSSLRGSAVQGMQTMDWRTSEYKIGNRPSCSKPRQTEEDLNRVTDDFSQSSSNLLNTCRICFSEEVLLSRFCCQFSICHSCFEKYLKTQIDDGKIRINCPNYECRSDVPYEEICGTIDSATRTKLDRFATDALRQKGFKSCPQCNAITVASETLLSKAKQEKSRFKVTCPVCELEWCYDCETPWHPKSMCRKAKSQDKLFKEWTKRYSGSQKNARKCPTCRVYIQKDSGCDSITCRQCRTRFCYKCGRRFGSSTHHCVASPRNHKGSTLLIVLLSPIAIPAIVLVAAFSLPFLIAYGGYKLVKAARRRQTTRN